MTQYPKGAAEKGSKKWIQKLINEKPDILNKNIFENLNIQNSERIKWLSPLAKDHYAEFYDEAFLNKVLPGKALNLREFWPQSGPRWDALGIISPDKVLLVEAKSHISELISTSKAKDPNSITKISESLKATKKALGSTTDFDWSKTFYQYANRLAHVYFLRQNAVTAHFVSVYFLNDLEMSGPMTVDEWQGAISLLHRCLGLQEHLLKKWVIDVFIDVSKLQPA